jgi:hypothetical protein
MVENLGFGALSCSEGAENERGSGFQSFCDEAVRFTHAYSPSVMSQATLGSILTAKYPFANGLRTNGVKALSAKEETLPEVAFENGYRTAFFSGGPPLWRRSGLNQGFDTFDDAVPISLKHIYRSASEMMKIFLSWQEQESTHGHFLSFLYLPDLQFIDAPTMNDIGEQRESSYSSQFDAVDDALNRLVKEMKRRKIWDSTAVFLVGLQANAVGPHPEELPAMSLFSESTRTTLMIKPPRKTRGGATVFNWKIDANVSLADVGMTLFDLIGAARPDQSDAVAPLYSLRSALVGPQPDWPAERMILSESAWAEWRGVGTVRGAARQGPHLYLFDEPEKLFNTLTDTSELAPVRNSDESARIMKAKYSSLLASLGYKPWKPLSRNFIEKSAIARELWRDREPGPELLSRLRAAAENDPTDTELRAWRATWALRSEDWTELKAVADQLPLQPLWAFLAEKNLGEKAILPDEICLQFLKAPQPLLNPILPKKCRVDGLSDLFEWMNESSPEMMRNKAMEQFLRFFTSRSLAERVAENNQVVGLRWDSVSLAGAPDMIDLILALPELKKYKAILRAHLLADERL